jgi:3-oxoacyl-[acyl-carrier protein] reductase
MILQDKVAIVTGSAQGIGKGIALRFAREGARVVVNSRNHDKVDATVDEITKAGGVALGVVADITSEADVTDMIARTLEVFGTIDVLVNNARTNLDIGERGPFLRMNSAAWQAYMKANLGALFFCTHQAARVMAKKRSGSIINISTNGAVRAHREMIAYDASKGAMEAFTRAVAVDLAPWQVRVNGVRPFPIRTENWDPLGEDEIARRGSQVPIGRVGLPSDVGWACTFLAADDAAFITGQIFDVDGGMLAQSRPPQSELTPVVGPDDIEL